MSIPPPAAHRLHIASLFQFGFSLLALVGGLLGAAGFFLLALAAGQENSALQVNQNAMYAWAWSASFLCIPALPSLFYTLRRLLGKTDQPAPRRNTFALASLALLLFPLALAIGSLSGDSPLLARFIFPGAALLATCLPVWWAVELARRGTDAGSPQRLWGTLNVALFFSTPLIFVIEMIGVILFVLALVIWAASDAQILDWFQKIQQGILQTNGDVEAIRALYLPILRQPGVLIGIYAVLGIVIPLVEELFKPLALWFLLGRRPTPAAGLALGAIAGAGFALPETLFNLAGAAANPQWLVLATGRVGTSLLHVATAALTGMAIASVWRSRKFYLLFLAYAGAAGLHGLWNALTITSGLAGYVIDPPYASWVSMAATAGLLVLTAVFIGLLVGLNRRLRPAAASTPLPAAGNIPL
jgi:hypothetical protein